MKFGTIALAIIFFSGGAKSIQNARSIKASHPDEKATAARNLFFGVLMFILGGLISVYYIVSLFADGQNL